LETESIFLGQQLLAENKCIISLMCSHSEPYSWFTSVLETPRNFRPVLELQAGAVTEAHLVPPAVELPAIISAKTTSEQEAHLKKLLTCEMLELQLTILPITDSTIDPGEKFDAPFPFWFLVPGRLPCHSRDHAFLSDFYVHYESKGPELIFPSPQYKPGMWHETLRKQIVAAQRRRLHCLSSSNDRQ
jgi:hypothetical protein